MARLSAKPKLTELLKPFAAVHICPATKPLMANTDFGVHVLLCDQGGELLTSS
eukprot:m.137368 g.137368  ORF g.137368 m.137368 type:complete len:53 (+) comp13971_c1_seq1:1067-1225(+)